MMFWILTSQSPLSWVFESFNRIFTNCPTHFPHFNLRVEFLLKIYFFMKNQTNFRKTVETGNGSAPDFCEILNH